MGWDGRGICPGLYQFTRVDCAKNARLEPSIADGCSVGRLRQGSVSKEKKNQTNHNSWKWATEQEYLLHRKKTLTIRMIFL